MNVIPITYVMCFLPGPRASPAAVNSLSAGDALLSAKDNPGGEELQLISGKLV